MRFASGTRLGPFEILSLIGAGGMGEVYRARDTRLDRIVALKLLRSEFINAPGRRVERFRHEARAIARITHPNICTLHDVGEDGSAIFLVMEYLEGATLAQRLEDGPLPLALALRTAVGIADGLVHAHRHGVVHRDIHPGNIILTSEGAKLLDFGLARLRESDDQIQAVTTANVRLTDDGVIVGTVPYMAPEQIEGREVDARTDMFSFGIVLFEMVAGRRPFSGDSRASLMASIVAGEPTSLSSIVPQTPPALERALQRCLAKDPDERWQTARDLAAELRWIAGETASLPVAGRRRGSRAFVLGGVAGALAAGLVGAAASPFWSRTDIAEFRQVTYRRGVISAARFTSDGQNFIYSASWEGRPYGVFLGRGENGDARDLQLPDARVASVSNAGDMAVVFGPQNIVRAFGGRTLARIPMAGGARRDLLTGIMEADWIPKTETLAVIRDPGNNQPWTVEFPVGTIVHRARAAWSLRVSPDGSRVAFFEGPAVFDSAPEARLTVVDRSGNESVLARDLTGYGLAWPPSGSEVWFTATRPQQHAPQLQAVSLDGVERFVHRAPDWLVLHDIAADGRLLVARNTIRISLMCKPRADPGERDLTWMLASSANTLSADGATVIFSDWLGGRVAPERQPTVFRRSMDGSPAVPIGEGRGAALAPDGRWVLTWSPESLVLLPNGAGTAIRLPTGPLKRRTEGAWLPDSRHVVFNGDAGDDKLRGYIQEVPSGIPRAVTPADTILAPRAVVRDEHTVLVRSGAQWRLLRINGSDGGPLMLTARDIPIQWSADGRYLYTIERVDPAQARPPAFDVFRTEPATGQRVLWKTLSPPDRVGVEDLRQTMTIAPDGLSYCYSYLRRLGDLFVVDGLN